MTTNTCLMAGSFETDRLSPHPHPHPRPGGFRSPPAPPPGAAGGFFWEGGDCLGGAAEEGACREGPGAAGGTSVTRVPAEAVSLAFTDEPAAPPSSAPDPRKPRP